MARITRAPERAATSGESPYRSVGAPRHIFRPTFCWECFVRAYVKPRIDRLQRHLLG
jgi:hypothetical protein